MIEKDGRWVPKISDFGISKTIDKNKTKVTQTGVKGTVGYTSPEALRNEKLDQVGSGNCNNLEATKGVYHIASGYILFGNHILLRVESRGTSIQI